MTSHAAVSTGVGGGQCQPASSERLTSMMKR